MLCHQHPPTSAVKGVCCFPKKIQKSPCLSGQAPWCSPAQPTFCSFNCCSSFWSSSLLFCTYSCRALISVCLVSMSVWICLSSFSSFSFFRVSRKASFWCCWISCWSYRHGKDDGGWGAGDEPLRLGLNQPNLSRSQIFSGQWLWSSISPVGESSLNFNVQTFQEYSVLFFRALAPNSHPDGGNKSTKKGIKSS